MKPITILVVALVPYFLGAQSPGQKIGVRVETAGVVTRGDTTGISTVVTNLSTSLESLVRFSIDAPAGVVAIQTPTPEFDWITFSDFRSRPMAFWGILSLVPPGSATPSLYFESVGLPGIVDFWAGGKYQLPSEYDAPDSVSIPDPLVTAMISGKTVGVEPFPANRSPQALLSRLYSLTQAACATSLAWVAGSTLCTELVGHLNQAEAHRASGQIDLAKASIVNYTDLLVSGQTSGAVSASGYWLLQPNAQIIRLIL